MARRYMTSTERTVCQPTPVLLVDNVIAAVDIKRLAGD